MLTAEPGVTLQLGSVKKEPGHSVQITTLALQHIRSALIGRRRREGWLCNCSHWRACAMACLHSSTAVIVTAQSTCSRRCAQPCKGQQLASMAAETPARAACTPSCAPVLCSPTHSSCMSERSICVGWSYLMAGYTLGGLCTRSAPAAAASRGCTCGCNGCTNCAAGDDGCTNCSSDCDDCSS